MLKNLPLRDELIVRALVTEKDPNCQRLANAFIERRGEKGVGRLDPDERELIVSACMHYLECDDDPYISDYASGQMLLGSLISHYSKPEKHEKM